MRLLVGLVCVFAVLLSSPAVMRASAQDTGVSEEEPVRGLRRWHPEAYEQPAESSSRGPVLELELQEDELEVSSPTLAVPNVEARGRRARVGMGVSAALIPIGALVIGAGYGASNRSDDLGSAITAASVGGAVGALFIVGGLVGLGISASRLNDAKREQDAADSLDNRDKRRVRWDHRSARWVF